MSESERPDRLSGREITVEDVRALAGPATPHFALQIRNRIGRLIASLPADHPARLAGAPPANPALDRVIELLEPADAERATQRGLSDAGYLDLLDEELPSTGTTQ